MAQQHREDRHRPWRDEYDEQTRQGGQRWREDDYGRREGGGQGRGAERYEEGPNWEAGYPRGGNYEQRGGFRGDVDVSGGPSRGGYGRQGGYGGYGQSGWPEAPGAPAGRGFGEGEYGQGSFSQGRPGQGPQGGYGQRSYGQGGYGESHQGPHRQVGQGSYGPSSGQGSEGAYGQGQGGSSQARHYPGPGEASRYGYGEEGRGGGWSSSQGGDFIARGMSQAGRQARRGPKGYKRSDERLKEDICEQLMLCTSVDSSEVTVEVQSGKVTLEGTVPERQMKHVIEDIADNCAGVEDVENRVRVSRSGSGSEGEASTGSTSTSSTGSTYAGGGSSQSSKA
jgi:hypothetical protein